MAAMSKLAFKLETKLPIIQAYGECSRIFVVLLVNTPEHGSLDPTSYRREASLLTCRAPNGARYFICVT